MSDAYEDGEDDIKPLAQILPADLTAPSADVTQCLQLLNLQTWFVKHQEFISKVLSLHLLQLQQTLRKPYPVAPVVSMCKDLKHKKPLTW
ncbi:hypothetical protein FRC07_005433 [Ceratobasidium sp. 392]|nr:hypothetical protein FRC07_005433 [Ceratobasidium sp. 392]